jgi:hypothetical protein
MILSNASIFPDPMSSSKTGGSTIKRYSNIKLLSGEAVEDVLASSKAIAFSRHSHVFLFYRIAH